MDIKEKIKKDLIELIIKGRLIYYKVCLEGKKLGDKHKDIYEELEKIKDIKSEYQKWYSTALFVVKTIAPDRLKEFTELYKIDKRDNTKIDYATYTISDYLQGLIIEIVNPKTAFLSKYEIQLNIIEAIESILDSALLNIEGVLQRELFDNEISTSYDLLKKNHIRAAGAVAGVILENHLKNICASHNIKFTKKNPTLSDFTQELKDQNILDIPNWRFLQRLGDIRNYCVHSKERDPTKEEVEELIKGVEKSIKIIF